MTTATACACQSPEPALINKGMDSLCEKCGLLIAPLSADAQAAEPRAISSCVIGPWDACRTGRLTDQLSGEESR